MFRVCHAFVFVHCSLVVTCWERVDLLALLYVFACVFVTFPCGVLGQAWYLIVSITDISLLTYFETLSLIKWILKTLKSAKENPSDKYKVSQIKPKIALL